MLATFLALFVGVASAQQGEFVISRFLGVNDTDSPAALEDGESQDALNVEANLSGSAILKRKGFTVQASLTVSTGPITGAHRFYDSNGNQVRILCHDTFCHKSTNGGAFEVFLTTATRPSRWSFVSVNNKVYGANSSRDIVFRYDGATLVYSTGIPRGSILELSSDRLIVGDTAADPSRVHYSAQGSYEDFLGGVDPEDSYSDSVGSPGDSITALKFDRGRLYIGKRDTLTVCLLADQYSSNCALYSRNIGTVDNESFISTGDGLYFKGQDGNFWLITQDGLRLESKKISSIVRSQVSGSQRTNTQTSQSDWQAGTQFSSGTQTQSGLWNTATIPGSIFASSITWVDTSSSNFSAGTVLTNISTNIAGTVTMVQSTTASFRNAGGEGSATENWTTMTNWNKQTGSGYYGTKYWDVAGTDGCPTVVTIQILNGSSVVLSSAVTLVNSGDLTFTMNTGAVATSSQTVKLTWVDHVAVSTGYIRSGGLAFRIKDVSDAVNPNPRCAAAFDIDEGTFTLSSNFVSQVFDTGFTTATYGPLSVNLSSSTKGIVAFQVQVASSPTSTSFDSFVTYGNGERIVEKKRAFKYRLAFDVTSSTDAPAIVYDEQLAAATTGQFVTQCIQLAPTISAFGILSCAETTGGAGSLVYYATSAASCALLPTTAPTSWKLTATNNATLPIAVSSAVYIGFRSLLGSATDQAQVDACTIYWNDGVAAPPTWGVYDSIKNAAYWAIAVGTSSYNNRFIKYDLNLQQWFPMSINVNAPRFYENMLYFGSSNASNWNLYGTVDNDDGAAIGAYWKSKDYVGQFPFQEKNFQKISTIARNQQTGSISTTYSLSNLYGQTYTINTATAAANSYIRSNYNLPLASPQTFINVKFANSEANQPFEVLGARIEYFAQPWRSLTQ